MNSVHDHIFSRVHSKPDRVFTSKDFLDLGGRDAVDQALSRLVRNRRLHRVGRGLYAYPKVNARLGFDVPPDPNSIAQAIGRRTGNRIAPSGAMAVHQLGLSTQLPAKPVFVTDGPSRDLKIGNAVYRIVHVAPKNLPQGDPISMSVFLALEHLGPSGVSDHVVDKLRKTLTARQRKTLMQDARYATFWIADVARKIAQPEVAHG